MISYRLGSVWNECNLQAGIITSVFLARVPPSLLGTGQERPPQPCPVTPGICGIHTQSLGTWDYVTVTSHLLGCWLMGTQLAGRPTMLAGSPDLKHPWAIHVHAPAVKLLKMAPVWSKWQSIYLLLFIITFIFCLPSWLKAAYSSTTLVGDLGRHLCLAMEDWQPQFLIRNMEGTCKLITAAKHSAHSKQKQCF